MFRLTERQITSLANMESYVGIRNPRTDFPDQEAFRAYWDLVARRCDAATRTRAGETTASREAQRKQRQERVTAHYQQAEHLFTYGREYAKRYRPSVQKLRQQLAQKAGDEALADQVMLRLADRLNDDLRARELAEMLQQQGRHARAIRTKLRQRLFTTEVIDRCLQSLTDATTTGSLLDTEALTRKVQQLQRKGLSQRAMRSRLMGSPGDGQVVATALTTTLGDQGDDGALRSTIARLGRKQLDRKALIQRLVGKGFRYADCVRILADLAAASDEGPADH